MEWPETITRVQCISESGIESLPSRYIRPDQERPPKLRLLAEEIPIIDLAGLYDERRNKIMEDISGACREWGFFQVINHGVSAKLLMSVREVSREFFCLPLEEKQKHANDPGTYVGYGSRTGVQKDAILDWGDYYYHNYLPLSIREEDRWPSKPDEYRSIMKEYCEGTLQLCKTLLSVFCENLGLPPDQLNEAFGGEEGIGISVRVNYYPVCPQPELTYGLSPHSDPGGITVLLQDDVVGLQVRKGDYWVAVRPVVDALTINLGDQMEILANGIYKSVEHSCLVNSKEERMSIAVFCNPNGDKEIGPLKELIDDSNPPRYGKMKFNDYRMFIRTSGPKGKSYLKSNI